MGLKALKIKTNKCYNSNMKKLISIATTGVVMLSLTSCGYQGHYRYPCQDPANWKSAECNPPICEASGTCTKDIVGDITIETGTANG